MEDIFSKVRYDLSSPSRLVWKQQVSRKVRAGDCCGSLDNERGDKGIREKIP